MSRPRRPAIAVRVLPVWAGFFTVMSGFCFVTGWTPEPLVEGGMPATRGIFRIPSGETV
ncbi:hypothetical protein [Streptosporangium longisporum]|uniref:Uncharacterized protein n=1 Tax=Streptosporangium longisporum TaxID=46187 RepID=A0ABP6KNK5_9ACTN